MIVNNTGRQLTVDGNLIYKVGRGVQAVASPFPPPFPPQRDAWKCTIICIERSWIISTVQLPTKSRLPARAVRVSRAARCSNDFISAAESRCRSCRLSR